MSAGSTEAGGSARGLLRRAFATRGASSHSDGSGAPSSRRAPIALIAAVAAIAGLAFTAAPASASETPVMGPISQVSYDSAHVAATLTTEATGFNVWHFETSTDGGANWHIAVIGFFVGQAHEKVLESDLTGLKGDTTYKVRFSGSTTNSPAPYPEFTTLHVDPPTLPGAVGTSQVFSTSATATGKVKRPANADPAFDVSACRFEYVDDADFTATGFASATAVACEPATPFTTPEGETNVTANLTGLSPATSYHLRLAAENAAPGVVTKEAAAPFTTSAKVAAPSVLATADATEVAQNSAKVSGEVQRPAGTDPALDVNCRFEYVSDEQFTATGFAGAGQTPCVQNPITAASADGEGKQAVSAELGLIPETTYHLRLAAENEGGVNTKEAAHTFTTPVAEKPVVTIDPVASGTYTTAHVSGTITGHGGQEFFSISSDGGATWSTFEAPTLNGEGVHVVEHDYTGLSPNTTYTFRIGATYSPFIYYEAEPRHEMAFSPELSITTEPLPAPTATLNPVTAITTTTAHLSAIVNPNAPAGPLSPLGKKAFATEWHIECTPACKNANGNLIGGTVQGEEGAQLVGGDAKGLEAKTHYEVTLVISSEGGGETKVEAFDTPLAKPTVKAALGASDGKGGYTLQGIVNPNNSAVTACNFEYGPTAPNYAFSAPCSPAPGDKGQPVSVEAHVSGLTPGATYHAKLVVTNGVGTADGGDQIFIPTLTPPEECPNEQLRKENSSLALPECRAYEQVTPSVKGGAEVSFMTDFFKDNTFAYGASGDIANSGTGKLFGVTYTARRTSAGWETIPNLNGPTGSPYTGPEPTFFDTYSYRTGLSEDLQSSMWLANPGGNKNFYEGLKLVLRNPDGTFSKIGDKILGYQFRAFTFSPDLSHVILSGGDYGPGLQEFVGTGADLQPIRADLDNSGSPISPCGAQTGQPNTGHNDPTTYGAISKDNEVVSLTTLPCVGGPPTSEIWARVGNAITYDVSASHCTRVAPACSAPADAHFKGQSNDGRRIFFTTTQQLVNGDTDETSDLYACDIPAGTPAPAGSANSCSSLSEVSGGSSEAKVEEVVRISEDGSTVYFFSPAVLATNKDSLGEEAALDNHNLYVWRTDAAHPAGQTTFVGRFDSDDIEGGLVFGKSGGTQTTPDGRYLVFATATPLVETDTDTAKDVYRYDADTGEMVRVSTNVFGTGGNGEGFDATIQARLYTDFTTSSQQTHTSVSNDGSGVVFVTSEALSPLDGNAEPDAYLWRNGHVSLISTGSVGGGVAKVIGGVPGVAIDESGRDIYFLTPGALVPSDGDDINDVYDARVEGGFSFVPAPSCSGEACQPSASGPPAVPAPATGQPPADGGNVKPCPKGKVVRNGHCVKQQAKKHHRKKRKDNAKRAGHNRGGDK